MNPSDIETLAVKLAALAQQLDQRSDRAVRHIEASAETLGLNAQQLNAGSERFAHEALRIIATQTRQVIADNVGTASAQLSGQLHDGARAAQQAARGLEGQRTQLNKTQTALVWKGLGALIVGALLAVAGSGYFAWESMQQVKQAHFGEDILRATQSGKLTRCGDVLCAKVGKRPQRYGAGGEYVLLEP